MGRLKTVSNANAVTRYQEYDAMGRATKVRKEVKDAAGIWRYADFETDYDLAGRVEQLIYPEDDLDSQNDQSNYSVTYDYLPGTGLIDTVTDSQGRTLATLTGYSPAGKIGTLTFDNQAETLYTYSPHSLRLTNITALNAQETDIINKTYSYSSAGDIITIDDMVEGDTYIYKYDSLHRLTEEDSDVNLPPEPMVIEFTYADDDGTQPLNAPETVTVNGESFILGYDDNGNMTDGYNFTSPANVLQRDIDFNSANMPLVVSNGAAQVDFSYDADSRRVLKATTGSSTLYFDTNFEVIGGTPTRYVFAGNLRIAKVTPAGIEYFHKDHLGSSTAMTGASGMENQVAAYLPFGMQRGLDTITSTGYTFTDQELDGSTGLYNYDARLYDPVIGMFVSADSVVPDWFDPQTINRYAYVRNNPLKYLDPDGHEFVLFGGKRRVSTHFLDDWRPLDQDGSYFDRNSGIVTGHQGLEEGFDLVGTATIVTSGGVTVVGAAIGKRVSSSIAKKASRRSVKPGDLGNYGGLKSQKRRFGETEALHMDHQPSFAAQVKARETALGRPLTKAELSKLKANTPAVASPRSVHQGTSPTYGGRNTQARIAEDASDLEKAANRDKSIFDEAMRNRQ